MFNTNVLQLKTVLAEVEIQVRSRKEPEMMDIEPITSGQFLKQEPVLFQMMI